MSQDDSVKCSDEMRNKPALLQDVLGEDRPSFKHNVFHFCRLKNFNTGHCYILFSVVRCIILKKRGIVIFRQLQLKVDSLHIFTADRMQPACRDSE